MLAKSQVPRTLLIVLVFALLGERNLLSENRSGLRGRVVYKVDHERIRNAYVVVLLNGRIVANVRADEDGEYSAELPVGVYDVLVSAGAGFAPTGRKVEVEPNGMMVFDAVLEFSPLGLEE